MSEQNGSSKAPAQPALARMGRPRLHEFTGSAMGPCEVCGRHWTHSVHWSGWEEELKRLEQGQGSGESS